MAAAPDVSIVIPTRGRPASLARAMRSVFAQADVAIGIELVVVDNDSAAGAQPTVEALKAEARFPVVYVCEPAPGVASARNRALVASRAPLIAFLDDDEEASPGWLCALLAVHERFGADVVFGPVRGHAPEPVRAHRFYLERFFSREGPAEAQVLEHYYGCGDSLIRRAALPPREAPFSLAQNLIGGEDDILFQEMRAMGARFAWAPDAWVIEHPAAESLSTTTSS
ncbi:MAG TPA: glycosyltransferase family 2 protein, partial [Caulobacteraceae bacterium]